MPAPSALHEEFICGCQLPVSVLNDAVELVLNLARAALGI